MADDRTAIFKQTEMFRDLEDDVLAELGRKAVKKKLARNEILFLAGEPSKGLYVVASGSVRAFRTSPDGREQVIHVEHAVTTIAEVPVFDGGNYPSTAAADEPSIAYFISRDVILQAATEHPQIAIAAAKLLASRLRHCASLVESLSLREVGQRLASLLLAEARATGVPAVDGVKTRLALTHNQLAARIGTVREVVTRSLLRLEEQGLIIHEAKSFRIPDIDALAAFAEDSR